MRRQQQRFTMCAIVMSLFVGLLGRANDVSAAATLQVDSKAHEPGTTAGVGSCDPMHVAGAVGRLVSALNRGDGRAFANAFVRKGVLHPYTSDLPKGAFIGRAQISDFVIRRYRAGDRWRVVRIADARTDGDVAVARVRIEVRNRGKVYDASGSVKVVVGCRLGLFRRWVGPQHGPPGGNVPG